MSSCGGAACRIEFRLSETPCFFSQDLIRELTRAALAMVTDLLADPAYHSAAKDIVPDRFRLPRSEPMPTFVQVDFGLVRVGDRVEGRLVELQAFPSLYGFQLLLAEASRDTLGTGGRVTLPCGLRSRDVSPYGRHRNRRPPRPGRSRADGNRSGPSEDAAGLRGHRATVGRPCGGCARGHARRPAALLRPRRRSHTHRPRVQPRDPR